LSLAALAVALSGCSSGPSTTTTTPPHTIGQTQLTGLPLVQLNEQDNRFEVFVGIKLEVEVTLPVASGETWHLVDPVGPWLTQIQAPVATAGTQVFAFRGTKTGMVTLRLSSSKGHTWYSEVDVWTINLSPKNFGHVGPGVTVVPKKPKKH
jgi:hypothetical protein